jgi:Ser/Thr protein kinase RdoA (MazF antagonist)
VAVIDGTPTLVVKQAGPPVDTGSSVAAEAAAYAWLAGEPDLRAVAPATAAPPRETDWLVLEAVPDARPVSELLETLELGPIVVEIACMLGRLHSVSARNARAAETLPARRPWVLGLPEGDAPDFAVAHPVAHTLVTRLTERRELIGAIGEVDRAWRASVAIHGDVKWDNVLARREPGGGWRLWLIDWELAGRGDPVWDLASLVEGVVTTSVLAGGPLDVEAVAAVAQDALSAYAGVAGSGPTGSPELLVQAMVARLAQVVVQLAAMVRESDDRGSVRERLLELAVSLAAEPATWSRTLFASR